jgi:hypothetical protein
VRINRTYLLYVDFCISTTIKKYNNKMKVVALLVASLSAAAAFAPAQNGRVQSALSAEKKSFFAKVFDMDLYAPVAKQNEYGARKSKNVSIIRWGCSPIQVPLKHEPQPSTIFPC